MGRKAKTPWFWAQAGEYCTTVHGRRYRLGPDKKAADKKFHALLAAPDERVPSNTVRAIIDLFLDWTEKHREELTYVWYRNHLQSFVDSLPRLFSVERLKPHHIESWVDSHEWGPSYRRGAMTAVARVFNWARKKGHIERDPIYRMLEKPPADKREIVLSPKEYNLVLQYVKGDFRDLVVTAWETGCRPQEVRMVEGRHVDLANGRWIFPVKESKGKKTQRIVYLSDSALAITKRRMLRHPTGPIFRRSGEPWTRYDSSQYFRRLKNKVGVHYRLYDFRHSFITNGLKRGVDPITMATLVGHTSLKMIHECYSHVSQDAMHMRKAAMKAIASA